MNTLHARQKRVQILTVSGVYLLGLLCVLNFSWTHIIGPQLYLGEEQGYVVLQKGLPLPVFPRLRRTSDKTIVRTSLVRPKYRKRLDAGIPLSGPYDSSGQIESAFGWSEDYQAASRFAQSEFVIGILIPCLLVLICLPLHYWAIVKSTFTWLEFGVTAAISVILMVILLPVTMRTHCYSDSTIQTKKALLLPPGASVLGQKKFDVGKQQLVLVLYRMGNLTKSEKIYSTLGKPQIVGRGDYIMAAIAGEKGIRRSLSVTSMTFPSQSIRTKSINLSKLKVMRREKRRGGNSTIFLAGGNLPELQYDFDNLALTEL